MGTRARCEEMLARGARQKWFIFPILSPSMIPVTTVWEVGVAAVVIIASPATASAEGRQFNGAPFPATAWAEGGQFNGPPSLLDHTTCGRTSAAKRSMACSRPSGDRPGKSTRKSWTPTA
jgi:hypothetical protein